MKATLKKVVVVVGVLFVIATVVFIRRASEQVIITNKPDIAMNALIMAEMGVSQRNAAAWDAFQAVIAEPRDLLERATNEAGGAANAPADWPPGSAWPFDFGDAVKRDVPDAIQFSASAKLGTLRANGYFDRLREVRLGDTPVLLVETGDASMFDLLLPDLGRVRVAARLNVFRMREALRRGDEREFLEAVRDNRFLARVVSQEFLIGVLVSCAVDALTLEQVRFAILEHRLTPETLRALDEIIRTCDQRRAMTFAVKAERIGQQDMIQRLFTDNGDGNGHIAPRPKLRSDLGLTPGGTPTGIVATLASFVIADRKENEAALDRFRDAALQILTKGETSNADLSFTSILAKYSKFEYPILYVLAPALGKALSTALAVEADVHATRILIALDLYKHDKGQPPTTLDALVPMYLDSLPPDSISGKAWVYKVLPAPDDLGRLFLFYSVGTDGVDNGGTHAIEAKFHNAASVGKDFVYNAPRE